MAKEKEEVKEAKEEKTPDWTADVRIIEKDAPIQQERIVRNQRTGEVLTVQDALARILNDMQELKKLL